MSGRTQMRERRMGSVARREWTWKARLAAPVALCLLLGTARPQSRIEGRMYDNLEAVNRIIEAVSREEFDRVVEEAGVLKSVAASVREIGHEELGLEASELERFRGFLDVQVDSARQVLLAGQQEEAGQVLAAVERMTNDACLACHEAFRREEPGRTAQALLMRSLLDSVQSVQRGLMLEDLSLVGREAREIAAVARLFAWPQVIGKMFEVEDPAEQQAYRRFFEVLSAQAAAVERGSLDRDPAAVTQHLRAMLEEGCVGCHTRHRHAPKKASKGSLGLERRVLDQ